MSWTTCGQVLIIALATLPAWFFGGVNAGLQVWLFIAALAVVACWIISVVRERQKLIAPLTLVPLVLAILWGGFQLVPLPSTMRGALAPQAEAWRATAAATEQGSHAAADRWSALSLYPASTRRDLSLLLLAVSTFWAAAGLIRTRTAFLWLAGIVAVNGAALAFFGLVQKLSWNGLLFWQIPLSQGGVPFASFVNRNNGAGYLNLALAAAIGLLVLALLGDSLLAARHTRRFANESSGIRQRTRDAWNGLSQWITGRHLAAFALPIVIVAGILASLSRGGILAMVVAVVGLIGLAVVAQHRRTGWIAAALCGGALLAAWLGMGVAVKGRMATLFHQDVITEARLSHWQVALTAVPDFWRTGGGLGTYRYVYRPYQDQVSEAWFYHAENQYVEALIDGGLVALTLLLTAIALVALASWSLVSERRQRRSLAVGTVAVCALISQAVHAGFDFGLYLPANFLLLAILCGAACGVADQRFPHSCVCRWQFLSRSPELAISVAVVLMVGLAWGAREAYADAGVETALRAARWDQAPPEVPPEQIAAAIDRLESAVARRPGDMKGQQRLAELQVHLYRVRVLESLAGENELSQIEGQDLLRVWNLTAPVLMYSASRRADATGAAGATTAWRQSPLVKEHLVAAVGHYRAAQRACPLSPASDLELAVLTGALNDDAPGTELIERAARLSPTNVDLRFRCGLLSLDARHYAEAAAHWQQCLRLEPARLADVLLAAEGKFTMDEIAAQILPPDPLLLLDAAEDHFAASDQAYEKSVLLRRAEAVLAQRLLANDETAYAAGVIGYLKGDLDEALKHLELAVSLKPERINWRMRLARVLLEADRLEEAHEQARRCVRMDALHQEAVTLLKEIYRRQALAPANHTTGPGTSAPETLAVGSFGGDISRRAMADRQREHRDPSRVNETIRDK